VRNIGIDEFSYRKRHRYLTVVVDHDRKRVIWVGHGRSGKTLDQFFAQLGPERSTQLENVTMDMSAGYLAVVREQAPQAEIVFDRFHVQRLASDAVDQVRRELVREAGEPELAKTIKGSRWPLLKKRRNLTDNQRLKLSEIEKRHKPLYRAYLLKESLAEVLENRQQDHARQDLEQWLAWASRSKLKPFVKTSRTIRKHKEGILAYISLRLTNGLVEGINNKIRVIARRAYGFHSPEALMGMVFLCCGGITLAPPLP
jgi:transposase